jgi:hypothetical protein
MCDVYRVGEKRKKKKEKRKKMKMPPDAERRTPNAERRTPNAERRKESIHCGLQNKHGFFHERFTCKLSGLSVELFEKKITAP